MAKTILIVDDNALYSALAREIVVRGTIRLTPRGYRAFQNDPTPYSYRT